MNYRFLARIVLEAETPLAVKSGDKDIYTDAVVMKDVNGLPYIPGSSLAGVIRHAWHYLGNDEKDFFGFQGQGKSGQGSRVIFSEARILNSKGMVVDGLHLDACKDDLLQWYDHLPVRQHVRINHLGVAVDAGKFDEQVVFAGTRFCFEMEMSGAKNEENEFEKLMNILYESFFRLGGGTRKGFGKIKVISVCYIGMSIADPRYLTKSSNLENSKMWWNTEKEVKKLHGSLGDSGWEKYELELMPENFFLFGSGFGDDDVDMIPIKERKVKWEKGTDTMKGAMDDYCYLLPATSVKGAIAHRVAFHYNKLSGIFAENFRSQEEMMAHVGKNNDAVRLLFGSEGPEDENKLCGNIILSDLFINREDGKEKILNHVTIDRFTGGAIDGALFSEKTVCYNKEKQPLRLEIMIDKKNMERQEGGQDLVDKVIKALKNTLNDICTGRLPLGGGVNRGNGIFSKKR